MNKNCFKSTLEYNCPTHGGWGMVRIGMLIPESYQLFICPFACGRHGALGAIKQGFKERLAYLYVEQSDIICGYDNLIYQAVDELLETLETVPKVLLVFVSCIDDLIGTDGDAVIEELSLLHSDIQFRMCHMNPLTNDSKEPPAISIQNNIYSLLVDQSKDKKDSGINSIGNLVAISKDSEIHNFLNALGYDKLRHISEYHTFEDYKKMSLSQKNIVFATCAKKAAEILEEKNEQPYLFLPISYDLDRIKKDYQNLIEFLSNDTKPTLYDVRADKKCAEDAIHKTKKILGNIPIIIDDTAVMKPFELARALILYGFRVTRVIVKEVPNIDIESFEWIEKQDTKIEIMDSQHHSVVKNDKKLEDSLSIGIDAAYISSSKHVVRLFNDEGMFGYYGVTKLMGLMREAYNTEVDLKEIIDDYGLVV